jgi:hypothetical protein
MKINRTIPIILVKLILFICLSLILCACVLHEQYPNDWAPLIKPQKDCLNITGTYKDDSSKRQPSLSYLLTGTEVKSSDLNKTNYVQINKGDNDALVVIVWNDNTKLAEKIYKKDDYTCTDEGIETREGMEVTTEWILGLAWGKVTLIRATDGSLVVMRGISNLGLFGVLLPIAADQIQYYKYSQKK